MKVAGAVDIQAHCRWPQVEWEARGVL